MTLAILCSGQGSQHPAMFDLVANHPASQPVFALAAGQFGGVDPRAVVHRPDADLHANRTGQILCCTQALAAWTIVAAARASDLVVVGYSIGDLAAWGCAGRLDPETVLALAAARAEMMDAVSDPGMGLAGIRGLRRSRLAALMAPLDVHIAIVNAADSFVVGGARDELDRLCAAAIAAGAQRAVLLPVHVASHTPFLAAARERFRAALQSVTFRPPRAGVRLLSGIDGAPVLNAATGAVKLAAQIAGTIDWAACLESCRESGADRVLELGPGHALATMARTALPDAQVHSVDDFKSAEGLRAWVAA